MNKLAIKALAPVIQRITDENGKIFFNMMKTCVNNGIDINCALKDTDDYNIFWENLNKFYKDYNSMINE